LKKNILFFTAILLSSCASTFAQNPYIRHFTTLDGLPSNSIYQIYQDSKKFLWFASDAGVIKFDGSNFTSFRKKDGLSSNDIVRIKEDTRGRIWFFGYNASVNYLYNNKIYNSKNAPFLNSLIGTGFILDFFTDSDNTIHFYNWQGDVFSLDINNNVTRELLFINLEPIFPVAGNKIERGKVSYLAIYPTNDWIVWSGRGIYSQERRQVNHIAIIDSSLYCQVVFPAGNNINYVKTYFNELLKLTGISHKEKIAFPGDGQKIKAVLEDAEGYLWIAAYDEGLYCMKNNKLVRHFNIKDALGLLQDHEQNIWISTQSDGIYMINHDILEQNHFDISNFNNKGVNLLCDFPGTGIWCTNTKSAFLLKNNFLYALPVPMSIQPVNIAYQFKDQTLLLGTISGQLGSFENLTFNSTAKKKIDFKLRIIPNFTIKKITDNLPGNNVVMFDQNRLMLTNSEKPSLNTGFKLVSERIHNAYFNSKDDLIVNASRNYRYKNNKLEPYPQLSRFDGTIISDHLGLNDSTELLNIDGDSLYLFQNQTFYNLTAAFDTPLKAQIKKILFQDTTLYVATMRDVFVCHSPTKFLSGLPVHLEPLNISFNNINDILIHKDTLYIASDDGLTVIAEASIASSIVLPPIPYLQSIFVNEKVISKPELEIKITGEHKIQLSFGCISFSSSPVIYSYKLEGSENDWTVGTGNGINLVYQNLPSGNYVFKLRVRKSNSAWSQPLELAITIKPTLFKRPVFWILVVLVSTALVTLLLSLIKTQKMKRVEVDHQLIVMEQKALQSMMNPHFIFNSLGSIQNYLLKNKGSEAVIYLSQFAHLIRQNLNAINTPMIALEEEIDRMKNYFDLEKKRLENKFDYAIEMDAKLEEDNVFIPSMIIQPIAENSIWHGLALLEEKGFIKISFSIHNLKSLKIMIEDNGIGMKKSIEYSDKDSHRQHLGMQIIEKRLNLLSKKYSAETSITYSERYPERNNPGTVVELIMPFIYTLEDFQSTKQGK